MELTSLSAFEQAKLVREKQVSAVEMLNAALAQIEKYDGRPGTMDETPEQPEDAGRVHAFVHVCREEALKKAEDVDRRIAAGEAVGPLAGVPFSAEDTICTKDIPTTAGSLFLRGWEPPYNAAVIERLDRADAVLIGKTNCDALGCGSTTESSDCRPLTRCPWDLSRVPGEAAGGSAAAAAAQEGAFSIGCDTRLPAAFCGVVGLKPTYGRISRWGVCGSVSSMDTLGPVTRTVRDAALVLNAAAGFDPRDNTSARVPAKDYTLGLDKGVRGLRIGISPDLTALNVCDADGTYRTEAIDSAIMAAAERTAELLRSLGAVIVEDVPMPNTKYAAPAAFVISRIETCSNLQRFSGLTFGRASEQKVSDMYDLYFKSRGEGFSHEAKLRLLTGLFASQEAYYDRYYRRALKVRAMVRADYEKVFDPNGPYRLDVLLTPSVPLTAPKFGEAEASLRDIDHFTMPMNLSGVPAAAFPVGCDRNGLPVGVQAVGADFREDLILRVAYACECSLGYRRPPILG